jgi:hypothetical protein
VGASPTRQPPRREPRRSRRDRPRQKPPVHSLAQFVARRPLAALTTVSATAVSVSRVIDLRTDIVTPFMEATRAGGDSGGGAILPRYDPCKAAYPAIRYNCGPMQKGLAFRSKGRFHGGAPIFGYDQNLGGMRGLPPRAISASIRTSAFTKTPVA